MLNSEKEIAQMPCLFDDPIATKKVRNGVVAHKYRNGTININGKKYVGWSMTDAIKLYRQEFPAYPK